LYACIHAGKDIRGTGNLSSDLRTWLSAVLANSDTCIEVLAEGLQVKDIASTGLNRAMSLVETLLAQVIPIHVDHVNKDHFPSWMREDDKMLLGGNSLRAPDAIVAIDGSGDHRSLTSAIQAAPAHSKKRYVIHVKSGVYLDEYVKITSDKWNIMLIGDGIGATVISGSRNGADGIQTYSTASFGKID
jgi:pectinesterase